MAGWILLVELVWNNAGTFNDAKIEPPRPHSEISALQFLATFICRTVTGILHTYSYRVEESNMWIYEWS